MTSHFSQFRLFSFLLTFLLAYFFVVSFASAQAGIGIKPAIIEDSVASGVVKSYDIDVTNLSSEGKKYYLYLRDIVDAEDNGAPIFSDHSEEKTGFEMSSWIDLALTEVELGAGESVNVPITVTVPNDAVPGSHFAAVAISAEKPEFRETGASVSYEVTNIISLRIDGDVVDQGMIRSFSTGNYIYGGLKVDFNASIENSGNTLLRPFGPLEITNMFNKEVGQLSFNESKGGVFPGQKRDFSIVWEDEGVGFGRYVADLSLVYGPPGAHKTMTNTVSFWVLPMQIILPSLAILAVLLITVFVSVKLYIRSQLRSVAGLSRRNRSRRRSGGPSAFVLVTASMLVVTALFLLVLLILFA